MQEHTKRADILIVALGIPKFIGKDMVKKGAVVIDVGIHKVADASKKSGYATVGDVDFSEVAEITSAYTPVPKGVGPMTIIGLLSNTMDAAEKKVDIG